MNEQSGRNVLRETDNEAVRLARTVIRTARFGALAVVDTETGAPGVSRVGVATDTDGAPLILVSMLSAHTRALLADTRCSLLLGEPGRGDPLAYPRIAVACGAVRLPPGAQHYQRARRRYLAHNPKASLYAGLGDFHLFRLEPERGSLNAGFGKAYALERADLVIPGGACDSVAEGEQSALDHMNTDHADAVSLFAAAFTKASGSGWKMIGIDPEGFDIAAGDEVRRIFFLQPLEDASQLRQALVDLVREARARQGAA